MPDLPHIPHYPKLTIPSIPLLNRQIHGEALDELCKIPLVIDAPPPHISKTSRYFEILDLISERLLQRCRRAVLSTNEELTPEEDLRNDSGDFEFWQCWDDFLNLFFLDVWTYGGHSLKSSVLRIGGAPLAGWEDRDPNLDHAHWLAHDGCRRYREKVLLLLHDGIRLLGGLNEVKFEGSRDGLNYLTGDALAGYNGPIEWERIG